MRKKPVPDLVVMMLARTADIATIVEEDVTGIRVVKSFAAEKSADQPVRPGGAPPALGLDRAGQQPGASSAR